MQKSVILFFVFFSLVSCATVPVTTESLINTCQTLEAESIEKAHLNQSSDIIFVSKFGVNNFNLETNEWSCKELNQTGSLTITGAEAVKSFQAAVQLSSGEPNLIIKTIQPEPDGYLADTADGLCDALNFPIRFSQSSKQNIFGCQISSLAKTAIMFSDDNSTGNYQIAFSAIYEPFVNAVIKD